jgi:hypothetical protein
MPDQQHSMHIDHIIKNEFLKTNFLIYKFIEKLSSSQQLPICSGLSHTTHFQCFDYAIYLRLTHAQYRMKVM